MPELSQEGVGNLSAGQPKRTYSTSHRPPITPRNSIETSHHPLESYPFAPEQILGHDTNLELPQDKPAAVDLLVRLLVDILVYSYDVDFHELHYALAACSPKLSTTNLSARNTSLLNFQQTRVVLEYADVIHKACETVVDNTQSLLKDSDREFISTYIMEPARTIGVDIAYVFEQLYAFRLHRCEGGNHHKTLLYTKPSFWTRGRGLLPGKLGMDKSQKLLARRLVSDDMVVAQLGTRSCEALRLVLGKAIKDYNRKHCKYGMAKIYREIYAEPKFIALKKELKWRDFVFTKYLHDEQQAAMASGQSDFRDSNQAEPRTSSRFLDVPRRNSEHLRRPSSLHDLPSIRERPERPPRPLSTSSIRLGSLRSRPARPGLWTNY
ncbi:uncharacterized protein J4E78_006351 [Alternaria triticimaculans]|uniref:uncharacterized protein n=1 Tax=Alternaria triticimaculans TaxID=297637 RepID=UPI0020C510E9|nr:uncharacterized protein J4E78_006351 [Alternaria triticimaculans]KAI4657961.1 hypothetical protein J4E78_006351 [Alternaria triticimaculans]